MMRFFTLFAIVALAACGEAPPVISIHDARVGATAKGQTTAAAYFTLENRGGSDRLIGIETEAGVASMHKSSISKGVMQMEPVESIVVPAHGGVKLAPMADHVMIEGVSERLRPGDRVSLTLQFAHHPPIRAEAEVKAADSE